MNIVATVALLCLTATGEFSSTAGESEAVTPPRAHVSPHLVSASVSDKDPTETVVTADPGDVVILPCSSGGNRTPSSWTKNGEKVGDASTNSSARVAVLPDGSLRVSAAEAGDEGSYLCTSTLPGNSTFRARALLQIPSECKHSPETVQAE